MSMRGAKLRFIREQRKLTQEELGRTISATQSQISRWELDKDPIPLEFELMLTDPERLAKLIDLRLRRSGFPLPKQND